ncbi:glycosyltransferase family 39 protein [Streptomyces sp. NPDC101165]|uniref:glycosyltransferase family 39 protein n=1 Tax=Streptomyces sp. NPDC101165 TaxID=3366119 RepID=UPI0037F13FD2
MHGVFTVFGDSLYSLRLPSVLAMACAAVVVTHLGSRLAGQHTGLAAGLAFALLPAVQEYAQEGRPYALVTACVALACRLLVAAVDNPSKGRWAAYGTTVLMAALLNWFSLLMLLAHAVTIALARPTRATVLRWTCAACAAVAGTLPLIVVSQTQAGQIAWIPPTRTSTLLGLALTLLAGVLCAWLARSRTANRVPGPSRITLTALALPLLVVPPLLLAGVSVARPVYQARYILFSHVGLALLLGAACHAVASRVRTSPHRTVAVVMVLAFLGLLPVQVSLRSASGRIDDVLSTAKNVAAVREPGDAVLYIPADRRDTAVVSPGAFTGADDVALVENPLGSGTLNGVEGTPQQIADAMLTARRIVVVTDASASPPTTARDRTKQQVLKAHFIRCSERSERGRKVLVYRRRPG